MRIVTAVSLDAAWANLKRPFCIQAIAIATFSRQLRRQLNLNRKAEQEH